MLTYAIMGYILIGLCLSLYLVYRNRKDEYSLLVNITGSIIMTLFWVFIIIDGILDNFRWYARKYYCTMEDGRVMKTRLPYQTFLKSPVSTVDRRILFFFKYRIYTRSKHIKEVK